MDGGWNCGFDGCWMAAVPLPLANETVVSSQRGFVLCVRFFAPFWENIHVFC